MVHTEGGIVLVTGATGNVGAAAVEALVAAGRRVRAVSRREREWPAGVEGFVGDLDDATSLARAADGVDGVFLLSGYGGLEGLLAALGAAGARRAVLLSSSSAPTGDETNAVARYHIESERAVRASGLDWTFLRPNSFMTNALRWAPQLAGSDVVQGPFGSVRVATIDPADVGAVAALALTEPGHAGRAYRLSGPEPLLPAEQVEILGRALGRELRFEGWSSERARAELGREMPAPYVEAMLAFFEDGLIDESEVLPTVHELLGRDPRPFAAWAAQHAATFATG
jgi:uncharacterized protein YbjT (DUF2867 family)